MTYAVYQLFTAVTMPTAPWDVMLCGLVESYEFHLEDHLCFEKICFISLPLIGKGSRRVDKSVAF
jgi:hypothetical protein